MPARSSASRTLVAMSSWGEREADRVEGGERGGALERQQRHAALPHEGRQVRPRQEAALAAHALLGVHAGCRESRRRGWAGRPRRRRRRPCTDGRGRPDARRPPTRGRGSAPGAPRARAAARSDERGSPAPPSCALLPDRDVPLSGGVSPVEKDGRTGGAPRGAPRPARAGSGASKRRRRAAPAASVPAQATPARRSVPAPGTARVSARASARHPRPAPTTAASSQARAGSSGRPYAAATSRASLSWLAVMTGRSEPGTRRTTPTTAFSSAQRETRLSTTARRQKGKLAASARSFSHTETSHAASLSGRASALEAGHDTDERGPVPPRGRAPAPRAPPPRPRPPGRRPGRRRGRRRRRSPGRRARPRRPAARRPGRAPARRRNLHAGPGALRNERVAHGERELARAERVHEDVQQQALVTPP